MQHKLSPLDPPLLLAFAGSRFAKKIVVLPPINRFDVHRAWRKVELCCCSEERVIRERSMVSPAWGLSGYCTTLKRDGPHFLLMVSNNSGEEISGVCLETR